jgi:hypothetical protein
MVASLLGLSGFALVGGAAVLWFRRIRSVDIPRDRSAFVAAWSVGALLGVAALWLDVGWAVGVPSALAAVVGILFTVLVAISGQRVGDDAIRVGAALPAFTAIDEDGATFDSRSLAGRPVLLKFFRGHW